MNTPLNLGVAGMGGFARAHHEVARRLAAQGELRVVCTCDPQAGALLAEDTFWSAEKRPARVFVDFGEMLDACGGDLDCLIIATPIHLHEAMHAEAVRRGIPVYLEKPPTLDPFELERMIALDAVQARRTVVPFHFIIEPPRLGLKRRLLAGEFGPLRRVTLQSLSPRATAYFRRNGWAGRLRHQGRLLLDSCFGNGLAHYVQNLLFWAGGPGLFDCIDIHEVHAELYRGHAIRGADTFFVETRAASSPVGLRLALSHATAGEFHNRETLYCAHATIRYEAGVAIEISWHDGRVENIPPGRFDGLVENQRAYYRYLRGEEPRPATTLEDARSFVRLHALSYISSGHIAEIPPASILREPANEPDSEDLDVVDLARHQERFLEAGIWPGEHGWGRPRPRRVTPDDLPELPGVIARMDAETPASLGAAPKLVRLGA